MIRLGQLTCSGIIVLGFLTACGLKEDDANKTRESDSSQESATKEDVPSFDPDKGLYLPEATCQSMGITTVTVQHQVLHASQTLKFQVFREEDEEPLPGMSYRSGYAYASTILTDFALELGKAGTLVGEPNSTQPPTATLFQINKLSTTDQTEVLVEIADPLHHMTLGDFCLVQWKLAPGAAGPCTPDSAVLRTTQGHFVYVKREGRFVRTAVKLGSTGEGWTEIREGVAVGDPVVTNPVQALWLTELKLKSGGGEP